MSELQIGLTAVGALVIACVIAYNRIQETRFRRRARESFSADRGDALLDSIGADREVRIEPMLASAPAETEAPSDPADDTRPSRLEPSAAADSVQENSQDGTAPIEYATLISIPEGVQRPALRQLLEALEGSGKRSSVTAAVSGGSWVPLANAPGDVSEIRIALQLADRRGHVTEDDLTAFVGLMTQWARNVGASVHAPDFKPYVETAKDLDRFCADVDVVVGLNVVPTGKSPFSGTKVHRCAEAVGFRLEHGTFRMQDEQGHRLFSLENQRGEPFNLDRVETVMISGVTLLLDVPRLEHGVQVFDRMVDTGTQLANALGGTLVDDNDTPVTEPGLEQIRAQLRGIYATMDAKGIPAGSRVALRLFS